jgi:methionine-rich copper-binding protein CopC
MLGAAARPVAAHTELVEARPAPGAQLRQSPAEVRLTFNEPLAAGSRVELLTDSFEPVAGQTLQFDPAAPQEIAAQLPPLPAGTYTVQWMAVSTDEHTLTGTYSFSVAPAASLLPGRVGWWIAVGGLILLALVIWLLLRGMDRRRPGGR